MCGYLLSNFGGNWATFYTIIWSHCFVALLAGDCNVGQKCFVALVPVRWWWWWWLLFLTKKGVNFELSQLAFSTAATFRCELNTLSSSEVHIVLRGLRTPFHVLLQIINFISNSCRSSSSRSGKWWTFSSEFTAGLIRTSKAPLRQRSNSQRACNVPAKAKKYLVFPSFGHKDLLTMIFFSFHAAAVVAKLFCQFTPWAR